MRGLPRFAPPLDLGAYPVCMKLVNAFWELVLFRLAPQELPASPLLLRATLAVYFVTDVLSGVKQIPLDRALWFAAADTAALAGFIALLLRLGGRPARLTQALTAVYGGMALLGLLSLPIIAWSVRARAAGESDQLPELLNWIVLGWSVGLLAHVLRHALQVALGTAIWIGIGYLFLWLWLMWWLSALLMPGA